MGRAARAPCRTILQEIASGAMQPCARRNCLPAPPVAAGKSQICARVPRVSVTSSLPAQAGNPVTTGGTPIATSWLPDAPPSRGVTELEVRLRAVADRFVVVDHFGDDEVEEFFGECRV